MSLSIPEPRAAEYLKRYGAVFVCRTAIGNLEIRAGADLRRALGTRELLAAWWVTSTAVALQVATAATLELARAKRPSLEAAEHAVHQVAERMRVPLTEHETALTRARAAVQRLADGLEAAKRSGAMKFFNAEFRRRRIAATASGQPFMGYEEAHRRLQRELSTQIATGTVNVDRGALAAAVFGTTR